MGEIQRKLGISFHESSPSGVTQKTHDSSSPEVWHMRNGTYEGSLGFLWWVSGTFCLTYSKFSLWEWKQIFGRSRMVCPNGLGKGDYSYHLRKVLLSVGNSLPFMFLDTSQGQTLQGERSQADLFLRKLFPHHSREAPWEKVQVVIDQHEQLSPSFKDYFCPTRTLQCCP